MRMLAHLYEEGRGTKDRPRAFYWYKTALESGDKHASFDVGDFFRRAVDRSYNDGKKSDTSDT